MENSNSALVKIKSGEISRESLSKYPIWTWYNSDLSEDENYICPLAANISDDFSEIFVKASFLTPTHEIIEGYIICHIDTGDIYAIGLFWEEEEYIFNKYASDSVENELQKLTQAVQKNLDALFPLEYQCDNRLKDIFPTKGLFNPL